MTSYLIKKRGLYYRPDAAGYTDSKDQAGRYTLAEAVSHSHPNGTDGPRDGITYQIAPPKTRMIPKPFMPDMVAALLDGTKTETRRLFKDAPQDACKFWREGDADGYWWCQTKTPTQFEAHHFGKRTQAGDLLWVKEAHYAYGYWRTIPDTLTKTGKPKREFVRDMTLAVHFVKGNKLIQSPTNDNIHGWYARPSMFMFKADSRLTLRVTDYRIERLQDITLGAICAEGLASDIWQFKPAQSGFKAFAELWDQINGRGAWDANPWVDVTTWSEVIHRNVLEVAA